jgi:RNA polymerase sigma factor (sigma-70 family)
VEPTDAQLVVHVREGDQDAFGVLVGRHRRMIWSVCYRVCGNTFDAEDALQDTLTAAWHHLKTFRGDAAVSTWLYRIAANAALAIARRRLPEPVDELPATAATRDFADQVADTSLVHAALNQLAPDFRAALVLRELCDFTYEQIAEHQQIGVQTVKSRISRARGQLRLTLLADSA